MKETAAAVPVIEFLKAAYKTRGNEVLLDLDLKIFHGETLILLGRSGSGKTTTLKMINRLLQPTGGEVRVEGRSTQEWDVIALRRSIGYAIQEVGLFPHFTVERNIAVVPRLQNWAPDRTRNRVHELLQLVGLDPGIGRRFPRDLSGGQRQRVGVARALAADPPILLMDEPFGALDPITRAELQREFLSLQRRLKKTVVFVTHDLNEALVLGTRIALLEQGRLVAIENPEDFLRSSEATVASYVEAFDSGFRNQRRDGPS